MTYRIPLQDLQSSDEAMFARQWKARIPEPISAIESDLSVAFHSQYASLRPLDFIEVCAVDPMNGEWRDGDNARALQYARYLIVEKKEKKITAKRIGEITEIFAGEAEKKPAAEEYPEELNIVEVKAEGTGGKPNVVYDVRDRKGNTIENFVERSQAEEFKERETARGAAGIRGLSVQRGFAGRFKVVDSAGDVVREFMSKKDAEDFVASSGEPVAA